MATLQCPTTLLLARHAEAEYETPVWSLEGGSLTNLGRAQARELAERVATRRVAHVWTSTLARAVQTGEIAAARLGVGVTTRHDLRELDTGDLVGQPRTTDPFAATYTAWLDGDLSARIPGGETGQEIRDRVRAVFLEIADAHPGETVLVISHGGVLRLVVPVVARMAVPPARVDNCSSIRLRIDADDWVCDAWDPS